MGRAMEVSPWLLPGLPSLRDLGTSWAGHQPLKKRAGSQGTEEPGLWLFVGLVGETIGGEFG